jgi:hypothetical protein
MQALRDNAAAMAACKAGNWAAAVAALNSDTTTITDSTLRTTRWLIVELPNQAVGFPAGTTEADVVLGSMQSSTIPRVLAAYQAMSAGGIDLSDPQSQELIPILAASGGWPAGLEQKVAEAGVKVESKFEAEGGEAPDVVNVQSAYQQIMVQDLEADVATGLNEKVNPAIASGDRAATAAALRQVADDVEADL